jgi:hypothetical protein
MISNERRLKTRIPHVESTIDTTNVPRIKPQSVSRGLIHEREREACRIQNENGKIADKLLTIHSRPKVTEVQRKPVKKRLSIKGLIHP